MGRPMLDLSGKRFGRLTAICPVEKKNRAIIWLCKCDCGNEVKAEAHELKRGGVKSCGCLRMDMAKERGKVIHGMAKTRLYHIWGGMRQRCGNENMPNYPRYGGRGISVCDEWKEFGPFCDWALANGYNDGLTLDRIDVNGNYEPSNCRWLSPLGQQNNRRDSTQLVYNGESHTIPEWERITGISRSTIRGRIRLGWTVDEIFCPSQRKRRNR